MKLKPDGLEHIVNDPRCPACKQGRSDWPEQHYDGIGEKQCGGLIHYEAFPDPNSHGLACEVINQCDVCGKSV